MRPLIGILIGLLSLCVAAENSAEEVNHDEVRLLAVVQDEHAARDQREAAIVELTNMGSLESAPMLLELMRKDPSFEPVVISSLRSMGGAKISERLQGHLRQRTPPLAKWIELAGIRRDPQLVLILDEWLSDGDAQLVKAASLAMAEIGTEEAGQRLDRAFRLGVSPRVYILADAYLQYAGRVAERDRVRAREVLDLVAEAYLPGEYRIKALRRSMELGDEASVELIKSFLHSSDDQEFQLAADCAGRFVEATVPDWLRTEMDRLGPSRRQVLERALRLSAASSEP